MKKQLRFTMDALAQGSLEALQTQGGFVSAAETIKDALVVRRLLHQHAEQGFSELVLRNPRTRKERSLRIVER